MLRLKLHNNGYWYVEGVPYKGHKRIEKTTGCSREQVEEAQHEFEKILTEVRQERLYGKKAVVTFADAAIDYVEARSGNEAFISRLQRLEFLMEAKLKDVDRALLKRVVAAIYPTGASAATLNRAIFTPVIAILNLAAENDLCEPPKLARPEDPRGGQRSVIRWIRKDEAERLIAACAPHLKPLVTFLLLTGARAGEALYLKWRDVDLDREEVTFTHTKNGRPRSVPLHPRVVAALTALKHREGAVFRRPDGKPYSLPRGHNAEKGFTDTSAGSKFGTAFAGACRRAKITNFRVHDCRHTWASWFLQDGGSLADLQELGGWLTASMVLKYSHADASRHRQRIAGLMSEKTTKSKTVMIQKTRKAA